MPDRSVAIVDDHPMLLEGIAALLKRWGGFTLAATGIAADDIVSIARTHHPDQMIVDLGMPGDAFQAISDTMKIAPGTMIVVFTASSSPEDTIKALDVGARGYVLKGSPAEDLFQALQAVQKGDVYVTPSFATKVICALKDQTPKQRKAINDRLSVREEQVVKLLLLGKKNNEIAHALSLSDKTVNSYMTSLMAKLNARNRLEAVIAAQRLAIAANDSTVARLRP